ncbi:MAG: 3-methyladenine DNA glycosylase [Akkermansiaceae bacterium]|nr:3-methyladenine DNA glycosylase [Akkermansiaceae bacterium]
MLKSKSQRLSLNDWQSLAKKHRDEVRQWTEPTRCRRASHQKHPVIDFLFTYYPFSLGKLEQWHPGFGVTMECGNEPPDRFLGRHYRHHDGTVSLDALSLTAKQIKRLKWIHNLLVITQRRTPGFACYGMHEWAMVYQGDRQGDIRHRESAPLRLSQEETDHIVETRPICCSHFDAYRFFAPAALGFNKLRPTLDNRPDHEQSGCLHTNMDLYKWASKCMPWVGSALLWQCFQLALQARELDMCASPYDLTQYGYNPIKIETAEGRDQYETGQRAISAQAHPLRQQIIDSLAEVIGQTV